MCVCTYIKWFIEWEVVVFSLSRLPARKETAERVESRTWEERGAEEASSSNILGWSEIAGKVLAILCDTRFTTVIDKRKIFDK